MFGGGEEYFSPPEEYSVECLGRFAALCALLRQLEKPKASAIAAVCSAAEGVGTTMAERELAAGVICRHIRAAAVAKASGSRQLALWYVLDQLAKKHPDTFRYLFGLFIVELGMECMPWHDAALAPKFEGILEHWSEVFEPHVIKRIYDARHERVWLAQHPQDHERQLKEEEQQWEREELKHQDIDGLDDYSQPCLAYLQGHCMWGSKCTQVHPPGLEGTLPPECRLGDWRCPDCGNINRHFRRRCYSCPRERPQYRRSEIEQQEDKSLCQLDPKVLQEFSRQFGYDPNDTDAAVAHWRSRLATAHDVEQYLIQRRTKLKAILERSRSTRSSAKGSKRPASDEAPPAESDHRSTLNRRLDDGTSSSAGVGASSLPKIPDMKSADRVFFLAQRITQRGVNDLSLGGHLQLLIEALRDAIRDPGFASACSPDKTAQLLACVKLVHRGYSVAAAASGGNNAAAPHPAVAFFSSLKTLLPALPLPAREKQDVEAVCTTIAA